MASDNNIKQNRWLTSEASAVDSVLSKIDYAEAKGSMEMRGDVARLRRIAGRMPSDDSKATAVAIELLVKAGLPLKEVHSDDGLTNGERAAIISLSLHSAAHRRSYSPDGTSFGHAIGLKMREDEKSSIKTVMKSITFDDDLVSLSYDLSRAVRRLDDSINIDYAVLTNDLILFQNPEKRRSVLNRWVKDYYRALYNYKEKSDSDE